MSGLYFLIGLTGPMKAGKSLVRAIFEEEHGFEGIAHSEVLRGEVVARGMPLSRDNYSLAMRELAGEYGNDIIARRIMGMRNGRERYLADGIRNPDELAFYREAAQRDGARFLAVAVDAALEREESIDIRVKRMLASPREIDRIDPEDFRQRDALEWGGVVPYYDIEKCIKLSDVFIINKGGTGALKEKVAFAVQPRTYTGQIILQ